MRLSSCRERTDIDPRHLWFRCRNGLTPKLAAGTVKRQKKFHLVDMANNQRRHEEEFSSLATQPTDFTHVVPFVGWPRNSETHPQKSGSGSIGSDSMNSSRLARVISMHVPI